MLTSLQECIPCKIALCVFKQEEAIEYSWVGSQRSVFWWLGLRWGFVRQFKGRQFVWAACQNHLAKWHSPVVQKRCETDCNLGFVIVWCMFSCVNVILFLLSQDKYVCIAVQGGLLNVLHNLNGSLTSLIDPQQQSKIKISNAQPKFVSKNLYLFQ